MPISSYNPDGTVDIYNRKTGEVRRGVKPEDLGSISPALVAAYEGNRANIQTYTQTGDIANIPAEARGLTISGAAAGGYEKPKTPEELEKQKQEDMNRQTAMYQAKQLAEMPYGRITGRLRSPGSLTKTNKAGEKVARWISRGAPAQNTITVLDNLKATLQLAKRGELKGSGTISDYEMSILADAADRLKQDLSDKDFGKALDEVRIALSNRYELTQYGVIDTETGKVVEKEDAIKEINRIPEEKMNIRPPESIPTFNESLPEKPPEVLGEQLQPTPDQINKVGPTLPPEPGGGITQDNMITNQMVDQGLLPEDRREIYPQTAPSSTLPSDPSAIFPETKIAGKVFDDEKRGKFSKLSTYLDPTTRYAMNKLGIDIDLIDAAAGSSLNYGRDVVAGLTMKGKTGQDLFETVNTSIDIANAALQRADEIEDPAKKKYFEDIASALLEDAADNSKNIQGLFSEGMNETAWGSTWFGKEGKPKPYWQRGAEVGSEVAILSDLAIKTGTPVVESVKKSLAEKPPKLSKPKTDIGEKVVETVEKVKSSTPGSKLAKAQAEAAKSGGTVPESVKTDIYKKAEQSLHAADRKEALAELKPDLDNIKTVEDYLKALQEWGDTAYLRNGGVRAGNKAKAMDALYGPAMENIGKVSPELYKYRKLLGYSIKYGDKVSKMIWKVIAATALGRALFF